MSTQEPGQAVDVKMPPKPQTQAIDAAQQGFIGIPMEEGRYKLTDHGQVIRLARIVLQSNLAPTGFDTEAKLFIGISRAIALKLDPILGLSRLGIVHNRVVIWGELPLGLCYRSGLVESFEEWFEDADGKRLNGAAIERAIGSKALVARCVSKRKGGDVRDRSFSVADAIRAGLWGKGNWAQYPLDQLTYKARARVLRHLYADVLEGIDIKEDLEGVFDSPSAPSAAAPKGNAAKLAAVIDVPKAPPVDKLAEKHADDGWDTPIETLEEAHPESEMPDFRTGNLPGFDDERHNDPN